MKKFIFFLILILFLLVPTRLDAAIEQYLCEIAQEYYQQKNYPQALHEYKKVLILNPENKEAIKFVNELESKGVSIKDAIGKELDVFEKETVREMAPSRDQAIEISLSKAEMVLESEKSLVGSLEEKEEQEEKVLPIKMSGEVRAALGMTSHDIIWKNANADRISVPQERNWRYLWGKDRYNTYDLKIYDRFKLDLETTAEGPWSSFMQINIDPWTFVGKNRVTVGSNGSDTVELDLKYWSNAGAIINETYRSDHGNIIDLSEIKVIDGRTTEARPKGISDWGVTFDSFSSVDIDRMYRPIRKFWVDFEQDDYKLHVFPISNQEEALISDDPLGLSNNHIWWEESPWLDEYEPSRVFTPSADPENLKKGRWIRRNSFYAKDSDQERLTFLRGASFKNEFYNDMSLEATVASPMSLWDEYENSNSIHNAIRIKKDVNEDLDLGLIYTGKYGLHGGTTEAVNQVVGLDSSYRITSLLDVSAEIAGSYTDIEEATGINTSYDGMAAQLGLTYDKTKLTLTHMDDDFFPALSLYRNTRSDQFYSQHISFSEANPENEAIRIGDGIDRGRNVIALSNQAKFLEDKLDTLLNYRNVYDDSGKYIETVFRTEAAYEVSPKFTTKFLAWYKHLPDTKAGKDPLIYAQSSYAKASDLFSDEDIFVDNSDIVDGEDPSIGAFGMGCRYDFNDNLAWEGIYERTNDPLDFPRGLFIDVYQSTEVVDGVRYDKPVVFLYDQDMFELPPYEYYSIYKTKFVLTPFDPWTITLRFTRNSNKYAAGIDDNINHTGLEINYNPDDKISYWAKYTYSKFIDAYRQQQGEGIHYDGHHNVFLGMDYNIDENQSLSILFGEFVGYNDPYSDSEWSLDALDTQHILRLYYNRSF